MIIPNNDTILTSYAVFHLDTEIFLIQIVYALRFVNQEYRYIIIPILSVFEKLWAYMYIDICTIDKSIYR